ncbi:MAG: tetratricopeptide repeat protein [Saprospiraceae bacterium]|jgi:tetratricopeptide (TPR) repeat protein|nr:tetratricopeptide repeat protein [Saprospiraceae bacterium]
MGHSNYNDRQAIFNLISKYEDMLERSQVKFTNHQSYHVLVDYYERECLLDRALEVVNHALAQTGHETSFCLRKAELLLEKKDALQALSLLDQVEARKPGLLRAAILRAEGLAMMGLHSQGLALLDAVKYSTSGPDLAKVYVCEALIYDSLKEYERMFYVLKAALDEDPSNTEALSRMWYVVEYARKHEESLALHERIVDADPYNALAWYNIGASQAYLCNYEAAIEAYEFAYLSKDDFEFAYRECAEVCLLTLNYHKALGCYQDVLERFEPDADLFLNIGKCYAELGNHVVARDFFQRAVAFDSFMAEAHYHIGKCFGRQKDWLRAVGAFQKAVKLEEKNEDFLGALAEAYCQTGNLKKALEYFREAADTAPEVPSHWVNLAQFLMKHHRFEDALEVLDEADENAWGPELLYCRSACLFEMGNKSEALLVLEEALYEDFDAHTTLFRLLPVLEKDKEVKAVIAIFQPE